jgi:hypothetical protein
MPEVAARENDVGSSQRFSTRTVVICAVFVVLWLVSLQSPIPNGKANRDHARPFLKELFPQRILEPADSVTAPVAAIFEVIRSDEPELARRAIDFAAEQEFGYAAPYVIARLGSGDPELERAAQDFLRRIAGADHGPLAQSWQAWWRDPQQRWFGVPVPQTTFSLAVPVLAGLLGAWLLWRGALEFGSALLVLGWFTGCVLSMIRLVGSADTAYFGARRIIYHADHGAVIGLEDAKVGGTGLLSALMATYLLVPMVTATVYAIWIAKRTADVPPPAPQEKASV